MWLMMLYRERWFSFPWNKSFSYLLPLFCFISSLLRKSFVCFTINLPEWLSSIMDVDGIPKCQDRRVINFSADRVSLDCWFLLHLLNYHHMIGRALVLSILRFIGHNLLCVDCVWVDLCVCGWLFVLPIVPGVTIGCDKSPLRLVHLISSLLLEEYFISMNN